MEIRNGRKGANEERKGQGRRNEKGYKKAEEFKKYLEGERSARDPRFDLKVFQYVYLYLYLFPSFPLPLFPSFPLCLFYLSPALPHLLPLVNASSILCSLCYL